MYITEVTKILCNFESGEVQKLKKQNVTNKIITIKKKLI